SVNDIGCACNASIGRSQLAHAPAGGRGGERISRGVRPARTTNFTAGDFRGFASGRDSGPPLESRSRIRPHSGAAYLQACLRHAEERQGTGGRDFGWDFEIIEGLARSCRGCEPRGFHLSERGTHHASVGGQSVATVYGAEAR